MDFENYIKSMAENCYDVLAEMTGQLIEGVHTESLKPPFSKISYKKAIIIPYENSQEGFEGRFVLGFNDVGMAVKLAGFIANRMGMPPVDQMNEWATDILFEFMNTVAGKVITDWDSIGMAVDFLPPEFVTDLSFEDKQPDALMINVVTLWLQNNERITVLTSLEEIPKSVLKGKKVLVVDDSKMIRFLLTKEFANQGCRVIEAENGLDGFIKYHADRPDLIIMDLIMPKMGGIEAIEKIREVNLSVPIIILTSTSKKEEVMAAAVHKVKGYIKKPIQIDQLIKVAQSCFH
ncbi:MAG: response regulator [Desulfobacteraceae bacterium]